MSSEVLFQATGGTVVNLVSSASGGSGEAPLRLAVLCFSKEAHWTHLAFFNNPILSNERRNNTAATAGNDDDEATTFAAFLANGARDACSIQFSHVPDEVVVIACIAFRVQASDFAPLPPTTGQQTEASASWNLEIQLPDGVTSSVHRLIPSGGHAASSASSSSLDSPRSRPVALFGVYFDRRCTKRMQWELCVESTRIAGLSWEPIVNGVRNAVGLGRQGEMRVPVGALSLAQKERTDAGSSSSSSPAVVEAVARAAKVTVSIGWDVLKTSKPADVDIACIALDASGSSIVATCFWAQLEALSGSVMHSGDNMTGDGDGDDESITIDVQRVPSTVRSLVFVVTSQSGAFASVAANLHCTLTQHKAVASSTDVVPIAHSGGLEKCFPDSSAFVAAVMTRTHHASTSSSSISALGGMWSCHVLMHNLRLPSVTAVTDVAVREKILDLMRRGAGPRSGGSDIHFSLPEDPSGAIRPKIEKQRPQHGAATRLPAHVRPALRAGAPTAVNWRLVAGLVAVIAILLMFHQI